MTRGVREVQLRRQYLGAVKLVMVGQPQCPKTKIDYYSKANSHAQLFDCLRLSETLPSTSRGWCRCEATSSVFKSLAGGLLTILNPFCKIIFATKENGHKHHAK